MCVYLHWDIKRNLHIMTMEEDAGSLPGPNSETLELSRDDCPSRTPVAGTSSASGIAVTDDMSTSKGAMMDCAQETTKNTAANVSENGSKDTRTEAQKSAPSSANGRTTSTNGTGTIKRTEEEEKLRKRLHAKREEDRLRDLLKRKRDSFRKNIVNGMNGEHKEMEEKSNMDEAATKKSENAHSENGKKDTKGSDAVDSVKNDRKDSGTKDAEKTDQEKMNGHDRHHRGRHRLNEDMYDRRSNRPPSDRHRHDRPPPYGNHDPPSRNGSAHYPRDVRPGLAPPPARSPYNHSSYDSRRHPPPPHQNYPSHPPQYHDRGRDGRHGYRGRPPVGVDIDPFGRQRRFVAGPDHPLNSNNTGANESYRRRSLSPSASNNAGYRRNRSRSRSRSVSSSGSSRSASSYSTGSDEDSSRHGSRNRKHRRSSSSSRSNRRSDGSSGSRSRSSSSSVSACKDDKSVEDDIEEDPIEYSKDQRTVFVTQLVMRTTVKDLAKFFKHHGIKVNEIELLRDRRSGQHKGSAYAELKRMIDVKKALELSGQAPTFQRFPILIKESEAERNLPPSTVTMAPLATAAVANNPSTGVNPALVATMQLQLQKQAMKIKLPPLKDANGQFIQSQKVYVGNLEVNVVTAQHLQLLFAPFGTLTEVQLQNGKGFAFLQYYDPKEAALAIQTMAGQVLAGRPMKTGWATNPVVSINGVAVVTSNEFPPDAAVRVQNAYQILAQLTLTTVVAPVPASVPYLGVNTAVVTPSIPTVADARASLAATVANYNTSILNPAASVAAPTRAGTAVFDPMKIGNLERPSRHVLVHNMFNKDEETDLGWEDDLREEFIEECGKYGTIVNVIVVSREAGGKIYTSFSDVTGAQTCARSLAGRWFDRRQLHVEYVTDEQVKGIEKEYPLSAAVSSTN